MIGAMVRPGTAEMQVLVACHDARASSGAAPAEAAIESAQKARYGVKALPCREAIASLLERGFLRHDGSGGYTLDPDGEAIAALFAAEDSPESFGAFMIHAEGSATYTRLCVALTGVGIAQLNMVDREQLAACEEALGLGPGRRLLDLGCGIGTQAEYLSDRTGVHVTGLDFSETAVLRARERTGAKRDRLEFIVGTMDALDLPPGSFDAAVAFDTLYFAKDLDRTIGDVMGCLKPNGRLAAFWSAFEKQEAPAESVAPARTKLGQALERLGLRWTTRDFGDRHRAYWETCLRVCLELRDDFVAEGRRDLFWGRVIEAEELVESMRAGPSARYLYVVDRGTH